ncbi:MAG: aldehyde dehydrogenase family protein [Janthinobacterium lividum]
MTQPGPIAASPQQALASLQAAFDSGRHTPIATRIAARLAALRSLDAGLATHEAALVQALADDLGKPGFEAYTSDILPVRFEIRLAIRHLRRWAARRPVRTAWHHWPARAHVVMEPLGPVLVLSPWNYPVQLSLLPVVSAIAAGNTVLLKPSEFAPATAAALARLLEDSLPGLAKVLQGDAAVAAALTALPWAHVFFTGSTPVGRKVAAAAAASLAPCTLELGGCNPCIVDATADIALTARRIVWGKFLNAGQTCLAPNHLLVHHSRFDVLLAAIKATLTAHYGADGSGAQRLAHQAHYARVAALLQQGRHQGRVAHGGATDPARLHVAPTVLTDLPPDSALLHQEIFGPILPMLPWHDESAMLRQAAAGPSPLAVYVHSRDDAFIARVQAATGSGALVVNDNIVQATVPLLPFGGLGASGSGRSHGQAGFDAMSNARSVYRASGRIDLPMRYPPYEGKLAWVKRLMG